MLTPETFPLQERSSSHSIGDRVPFVDKQDVTGLIERAGRYSDGCMFVMYGPSGAGKSSYLMHCANQLRDKKTPVLYLSGGKINVHAALEIPQVAALEDWIPEKSLIIIDDAENIILNEDNKNYLRSLATSSRNTRGHFNVIVALSEMENAKVLLMLNRLDKVKALSRSERLKWTEKEVLTFLQNSSSLKNHNRAQELGEKAATPAFLEQMHMNMSGSVNWEEIAQKWQDEWKKFQEIDKDVGITLDDHYVDQSNHRE